MSNGNVNASKALLGTASRLNAVARGRYAVPVRPSRQATRIEGGQAVALHGRRRRAVPPGSPLRAGTHRSPRRAAPRPPAGRDPPVGRPGWRDLWSRPADPRRDRSALRPAGAGVDPQRRDAGRPRRRRAAELSGVPHGGVCRMEGRRRLRAGLHGHPAGRLGAYPGGRSAGSADRGPERRRASRGDPRCSWGRQADSRPRAYVRALRA